MAQVVVVGGGLAGTAGAVRLAKLGHAVTLVGYDDRSQTFKFINQWSTQWGDQGYGRMTYDTFVARVYEGYVMHLPGDPEVTLTDADFQVDVTPPPQNTPLGFDRVLGPAAHPDQEPVVHLDQLVQQGALSR